MIYYAVTVIEVRGPNYLLPVDVNLTTERQCGLRRRLSLSDGAPGTAIAGAKKLKLIVLDAGAAGANNSFASGGEDRKKKNPLEPDNKDEVGWCDDHACIGASEMTARPLRDQGGRGAIDGDGENSPFTAAPCEASCRSQA